MTDDHADAPVLPRSTVSNKFPLISEPPRVVNAAGKITIANRENFPVVAGQDAAVYLVRMMPGALREPHWHPNCWEMNVVLSGQARVGVVNPDDTWSECTLGVGEVSFIPMGYFHYIEALGTEELVVAVVFNSDMPQDIGLSTGFSGMPTRMFSETLGRSLSGWQKAPQTLYLVPGTTSAE